MDDSDREARTFRGPGGMRVFVPPPPPPHPDDYKRDLPPGDPPRLFYLQSDINYWSAVENGEYLDWYGKTVKFDAERWEWLRRIRPQVEDLMRSQYG